MAIAKAPMCYV